MSGFGSVGSGVGSIPDKYRFADTAARDAYFTANPSELVDGLYVAVGNGFQRYDDPVWTDVSGLLQGPKGDKGDTGAQGPIGPGSPDNTGDGKIPFKASGEFEDSPLSWSGVPGENVISSETIEVPPGTIQIGEGLKMSAAGVIPIFNSLLTGKKYVPNLFEYDSTGSNTPFALDIAAETQVIVQADFSASTPLTGTFNTTTTTSQFINSFELKTNASAVLAGVKLQLVSQSTGEPIYYFPSKAAWEDDTGEDLTADGSGNIKIGFEEAPLGLLVGETITTSYKIDSGVLLGTGTVPYHAIDQQIATFVNMATEPWVVDYVAQHGGGGATTFTELTDTPANKNVPGIQNVVVNPFDQEIQFKEAELTDNEDIQISAPASGEILKYDEGIAKWINDEPRFAAALQSFNDVDYVDGWQDQGLSILFANDNNIIDGNTPQNSREGDVLAILNMNTEFGKTVIMNALVGQTINGGSSYTVHDERVAFFVKTGTDWKFGGENTLVTTLTGKSVTDLTDVSDAGGGVIPSTAQLAKVDKTIATFVDSGATEFDVRPKFKAGPGIQLEETENTTDTVTISNTQNLVVDDGTTSIGGVDNILFSGGATVTDKGSGEVEVDITGGGGGALTVRNDSGGVAVGITDLQFVNSLLNATPPNAQFTPLIDVEQVGGAMVKAKKIDALPPLEVSDQGSNVARIGIAPGSYEPQHVPSYYASLSDEVEVVGLKSTGVRTGVLWFGNIIKPAGTYISVDRTNKRIGLQEDDTLDPNVTGGTAYLMFYRVSFKGTAAQNGFIQIAFRDAATGDILEDDNGNLMAVRKDYKTDQELGLLEITAIKKYTGIEYFKLVVEESFDGEALIVEDRTEGNSCIMIQAIDTDEQTSRSLLQMENDVGVNIEWTSHYLGTSLYDIEYFLKEDRTEATVPAGTGETGADGWHYYNWNQAKVGVASGTLTIEDDGTNLLGFSLGDTIGAEKTQLLRGKSIDVSITITTIKGAANVYGVKWTGVPDAYTKTIVTGMTNDQPVLETDWELLPNPIFCIEDPTGSPNTRTGTLAVPADAENLSILLLASGEQQPNKYEITAFKVDVNPAFNGYFIHAPEVDGEKHLVESEKYLECGLNTEGYSEARYTINQADTPMPAGKTIKGNADITPNWAGPGNAVDFLTFNEGGDAKISTTFNVYPGESVPSGQTSTNNFWWAEETAPGVWTKLPDSEIPHTAVKDVPVPQLVTIPAFLFKAKVGSKLRCYAKSSIDDGAYIESMSPHVFLCQTTIDFEEYVPGSEDEPVTSIYVQDELFNDWELTAGTDGHLRTLLVGDLPENIDHHVLRSNFSGNDFDVDEFGSITLVEKTPPVTYTEISANVDLDDYRDYIVDTTSNTVTINVPYEQETPFSVRDWKKKFGTNSCFVTIRDEFDAIAHTAELDRKDRGYIFYAAGGAWKYGEIGKGSIVDIASDHVATVDFPDSEQIEFEDADLPANTWTTFNYPSHFETHCPSSIQICDDTGLILTTTILGAQAVDHHSIKINPGVTAIMDCHIVISR